MFRTRLSFVLSKCLGPWRQTWRYSTNVADYQSYYDVLEVEPSCTKTEIRESWLRLSMLYHPDLNQGDENATKHFMEVKEAYKVLVDDDKRNEYNDKIGYSPADPPPDFEREWSYKAETDRIKANVYRYMWDEEKIRKLMSSERLREVDWNKQTPAERHQILTEEERRQSEANASLAKFNTPTLVEAGDKYFLMVLICIIINFALQRSKKNILDGVEEEERINTSTDVVTDDGGVITRFIRDPAKAKTNLKQVEENVQLEVQNSRNVRVIPWSYFH